MISGLGTGILVYGPDIDELYKDTHRVKEVVPHFWMGDDSAVIIDSVLCWKAAGVMGAIVNNKTFAITKDKTQVKCQECLELIHS